MRDRLNPGVVVLAGSDGGDKLALVCMVTPDAGKRFHAGQILGALVKDIGGKGGGRPDMAQGGGPLPADMDRVLDGWRASLKKLAAGA